jgi:hypothetical protein
MAGYGGVVYYDDPITFGIGARPTGMGSAFVALADDANAMFLNPAGLGTQKSWKLSSMNSNFLNEYQYTMFCGVDPTPYGTIGVGYVSSRIGDITNTSPSGEVLGTSDFFNQAVVLSYGKYIGDIVKDKIPFINLKDEPDIYGGATFKYYTKGYSGFTHATGSGYNLDLGLKYDQTDWLSYGVNFQNVLSGSKILGDFDAEDLSFLMKTGVLFRWLEHDVNLELDDDMYLGRANVPWPLHFGAEWNLHPNLSLRAGADQVVNSAAREGGNVVTNTTFGLTLDYNGVKVDLAYVQNYAQLNLASNVISLSLYSQPSFLFREGPPANVPAPAPVAAPAPAANIAKLTFAPATDMATIEHEQYFNGTVAPDISNVWLAGKVSPIKSGTFEGSVPLDIGKNNITVKIRDKGGAEAETTRRIIRFYVPEDISQAEARSKPFEYMVVCSMIRTYLGKDFGVKKPITRAVVARVIAKAKNLNTSSTPAVVFKDVKRDYDDAAVINAVKAAKIMGGYTDGTFKPENNLTLGELAQTMTKAAPNMNQPELLKYLSTRPPKDNASMGDLIEMLLYFGKPGMLSPEIEDYKAYIGAVTP